MKKTTTIRIHGKEKLMLICFLLKLFHTAPAQNISILDSAIKKNSYTIINEKNGLGGSGVKQLLGAIKQVPFVLLGEEHNAQEVPVFTTKLFQLLHEKAGFNYFATEQDPIMMQKIGSAPYRGNIDSINALAKRYLKGFTFISDQELQMLAAIGKISTSTYFPIWGCEQVFGITHVLEALLLKQLNPVQKNAINHLLSESRNKESSRQLGKYHYMSDEAKRPEVKALQKLLQGNRDKRTQFLMESIVMSDSIYHLFNESQQGFPLNRYYNNIVREQYMKKLFMLNYQSAKGRGDHQPRVLFKFGQQHLYKGLNPLHVLSLGNFVNEFATAHDQATVSIFMALHKDSSVGKPISVIPSLSFLAPFARLSPTNEWTLIDLQPLRPMFRMGYLDKLVNKEDALGFRTLIFGFDYLLLFGNGRSATFSTTNVAY